MHHSIIITSEGYSDLNPVSFGYQNCISSHSFGPAIRDHWLIHFVVSGSGIFRIKNKTYKLKQGEMFVIPPYEETYYEADKENPWYYIWIGFTTKSALPKELPDVISCPDAITIFNAMKNCRIFSDGRSAYLSARLWDLFAILLGTENTRYDYVDIALECIHSEYMKNITVESIAKRLNLDRTYFSVIFKNKIGIPPKQYLFNYRMKIAASLLTKKKTNISVVAHSAGYSDIYVFSKMFKRHFGVSPTEYAQKSAHQIKN